MSSAITHADMTVATAAAPEHAPSVPSGWSARAAMLRDARTLGAGLAISGSIVVGMYLDSRILIMLGALAAIVAGIAAPAVGLVVVAFMGPLRPPPVIPAPGFNLVLVAAILVGCLYRLPVEQTRVRTSAPLLLLLAYALYVFAQQLPLMLGGYAGEQAHDIGFLFFQLLTGIGAIIAAGFVLRSRSPNPVLTALLLSATFAAILAILTADGDSGSRLANLRPPSDVASRATGPFGNPNSFGQFLAYACTLAAGWFVWTRSLRVRSGLMVAAGVMGYALSLSLSRGAIVALLSGLVVLAFTRSRRTGLVAVGVALALGIVGYPLFVQLRLATEAGSASAAAAAVLASSDEARLGAILAGPALFTTSPIFGIGFGQYKYVSALVSDEGGGLVAHNWYGTVLAEQGLLGIVLWLLMLIAVAAWLRARPPRPRSMGGAMLGAAAVGCMFLEPPTSFQTAVVPAMVLTAALVANWTGRADAPAGETGRPPPEPVHRPGRPVTP